MRNDYPRNRRTMNSDSAWAFVRAAIIVGSITVILAAYIGAAMA